MAGNDLERTRSSGTGTVIVGVVLFAILFNLIVFTSAGTGLTFLVVLIPGVFSFGYWVGYRLTGKSPGYYFGISFSLGLLTWVIFLIGFAYYGWQVNTLASFVRVCVFATLLCVGGALIGDMATRKQVKMNTAVVASITAVVGAIAGIAQLFK